MSVASQRKRWSSAPCATIPFGSLLSTAARERHVRAHGSHDPSPGLRGAASWSDEDSGQRSDHAEREKKVLKVITREGQTMTMNMQVTDVNKVLMSVARICDGSHRRFQA